MALTVVVGCKLPHGLQIRLGQKTERVAVNDARDAHIVVLDEGQTVRLNGSNHRTLEGLPASVAGYGLTSVDGDAFKAWLTENKNHPAVKNGLIFVEKDASAAKDEARDRAEIKNGFERLDYDNPMGDKSVEPTKTLEQAKADAAEQVAQV